MSSAQYQALPTSPSPSPNDLEDFEDEERPPRPRRGPTPEELQLAQDPRFNPPTPSAWKRVGLIVFIVVMFWLSFQLRTTPSTHKEPEVVHADRYSKTHKFRPAASPIITEALKDGRVRLRGAQPTVRTHAEGLPIAKVKKGLSTSKRAKKTKRAAKALK
ncbi:hypothetical protein FA95DRAFT_1488372 [Auriscalpium vulgare]|uniref:Uncharacterized protein n=1 Tax=Auriscalpium vulgare TaxID=40419 RepID=A0ACB8S0G1_9AGAM|nr:hypothetical protein FA95DRAFT_1488372 [Auriscalpium vulgare]